MKTRNAVFLAVTGEILIGLLAVFNYGAGIEGLQAITRYSGRFSLLIFSFIFLLHPAHGNFLRAYLSPDYFLVFAVAHGIHLIELLSYVYLAGIELVPYRVAGGFLAYAFIFFMPWIQHRFQAGLLSITSWNKIALAYSFYVWLIFFMTYLARVNGSFPQAGKQTEHLLLMSWVCVMVGWKVGQLLRTKRS